MTTPDKNHDPQHPPTQRPKQASNGRVNAGQSATEYNDISADSTFRAITSEDILAYVECTLGFRPSDSLVIVALAGNRLSTVVRCDLPDDVKYMLQSDTPETVIFMDMGITEVQELHFIDLGRRLGQLIKREPSITKCLLIYLPTAVGVSDHHALAVVGTANAMISAQLGVQRVPVDEAWLIHHNALWHLRCAATTECDTQGIAIGNPKESPLHQHLAPAGTQIQETGPPRRRLAFPPALKSSPETVQKPRDISALQPQVVRDWLQLWDQRLANGPSMLDIQLVEQLLAAISIATLRDAILAMACFDLSTAMRGMATLGHIPKAFAQLVGANDNHKASVDVHECFKGQSKRIPDWRRIAELERLCHQLLPLADGASAGHLAGVLIWIEWVRGRGSIALHYAQQAVEYFPNDPFIKRYEGMLYQGMVAQWATRTDSAWTPQHAA